MPDNLDYRILRILQENARTSTAEIARRLGASQQTIHERIRKLEARGIIQGYSVRIDSAALDLRLTAFVFVRTAGNATALELAEYLTGFDEIQEIHHVTGEDCLLVKVRVPDTNALWRLFVDHIERDERVGSTQTTIAMRTEKETSDLPLPVPDGSLVETAQ